jgi:Domain of unknown function (DUF4260)
VARRKVVCDAAAPDCDTGRDPRVLLVEDVVTVTTDGGAVATMPRVPRSRLVYAVAAVVLMAGGGALVATADTGLWQLVVFAVLPDIAILAGVGRGLARGQLHPRAVPLYNALHRLVGPVALAAIAVFVDVALLIAAAGWAFHICFDHAVGLGPRTPQGFVQGRGSS